MCHFLYLLQVLTERARTRRKPPILLKIAPDLTAEEKADIADIILSHKQVWQLYIFELSSI